MGLVQVVLDVADWGQGYFNLRPAVAFQVSLELLGDADDAETPAETIHVDAVMRSFHLVALLSEAFQLKGWSRFAIAGYCLKSIFIANYTSRFNKPSTGTFASRIHIKETR